ncbi:MAG: hypothetical protein WBN75_13995 [Verrucomicrobiia bacterium]
MIVAENSFGAARVRKRFQIVVLKIRILHPSKLPYCDKSKPWLRFVTISNGKKDFTLRNFQVLGELTAPQAAQVKV